MEVLTTSLVLLYLMLMVTLFLTVLELNLFIGWMRTVVYIRQKWLGERIIFEMRRLHFRVFLCRGLEAPGVFIPVDDVILLLLLTTSYTIFLPIAPAVES